MIIENKLSRRFGYSYTIFLYFSLWILITASPIFLILGFFVFELAFFGSIGYLLLRFDKSYKEKLDSFLYTSYFRFYFLGNPMGRHFAHLRLATTGVCLWAVKVYGTVLELDAASKLAKQSVLDAREAGLEPDLKFFIEQQDKAYKNMPIEYTSNTIKEGVSKMTEMVYNTKPK